AHSDHISTLFFSQRNSFGLLSNKAPSFFFSCLPPLAACPSHPLDLTPPRAFLPPLFKITSLFSSLKPATPIDQFWNNLILDISSSRGSKPRVRHSIDQGPVEGSK